MGVGQYQIVWFAWTAIVVLALVLAFVAFRFKSPLARNMLWFVAGIVAGQALVLVLVGIPVFVATAFTEGAEGGARLVGVVGAYVFGAAALMAVGRACGRNPSVPWWFIAGAVAIDAAAVVRALATGLANPGTALYNIALSVLLASALGGGFLWGRRAVARPAR
jgi:hypothetical protein